MLPWILNVKVMRIQQTQQMATNRPLLTVTKLAPQAPTLSTAQPPVWRPTAQQRRRRPPQRTTASKRERGPRRAVSVSRWMPSPSLRQDSPVLACRKRRIKCGEERPTCANCIKSKRSCEGYAPRLTFKDPLGAYRPAWPIRGAGPHYQSVPAQSGAAGLYGRPPLGFGAGQSLLPAIAPRPNPQYLPHEGPGMPDGRSPEWPAELYHPVEHHSGVAIQPPSDIPSRTYHPPNSATSDLYQPSSATDSPITLRDFQDPRSIQRTPTSGNGGYIGALHSAYPSPEWMRHPSMHEEYSRQIADGYHPPFLGFETRNDTRVKHQRYSGEPAGQPLEDSINLHHFSASLPSNPPAVTALHNHVNVSPHRWAIKRGLEIPDDTSVGKRKFHVNPSRGRDFYGYYNRV